MRFPVPAVAGMDAARQALSYLTVDPAGMKGVLIAGGPGNGKSMLVQAFRALLPSPSIEVPAGVTEDQLLGCLDLAKTLVTENRRVAAGLLARAHGGVLFINEINLLERGLLHHVLRALNSGMLRVERDGLSTTVDSEFALVGTYDPQEGELEPALLDAVGIHVRQPDAPPLEDRIEVLHRVAAYESDPKSFLAGFAGRIAEFEAVLAAARSRVPRVAVRTEDCLRLIRTALQLGVEGNRADVFAVRCARVSAALRGSECVEEQDLQSAVRMVLFPRQNHVERLNDEFEAHEPKAPGNDGRHATPIPAGSNETVEQSGAACMSDLLVAADADVYVGVEYGVHRTGKQPGGRRARTSADAKNWIGGRYSRAVPHAPKGAQISIYATVCAAASRARGGRVRVAAQDLRFKQYNRKCGILHLFVVDASGSMALNRIGQAKGAIMRLLQNAYLHRDSVALISFRGERAEVQLPPTRSVELAKRALDALPVGGGTPLAAGLDAACRLARRARSLGTGGIVLVLFTDGRPNVASCGEGDLWRELESVCAALRSDGVSALLIDTNHRAAPADGIERIAGWLGGKWMRLPDGEAGAIAAAVAEFSPNSQSRRLTP